MQTASAIYTVGYITGIIPRMQPEDLGLAATSMLFRADDYSCKLGHGGQPE